MISKSATIKSLRLILNDNQKILLNKSNLAKLLSQSTDDKKKGEVTPLAVYYKNKDYYSLAPLYHNSDRKIPSTSSKNCWVFILVVVCL